MLETLRVAPSGSQRIAELLNLGADKLVEAGKLEIMTPMYVASLTLSLSL